GAGRNRVLHRWQPHQLHPEQRGIAESLGQIVPQLLMMLGEHKWPSTGLQAFGIAGENHLASGKKLSKNYVGVRYRSCCSCDKGSIRLKGVTHEYAPVTKTIP